MAFTASEKTPLWFWLISTLALVWNIAGLAAFIFHLLLTPDLLAELPPEHARLYTEAPEWLDVAFGIAVVGGVLASVMLLLRNIFAVVLFSLSLLGVLAQNSYSFFMSDTFAVLGQDAMIMPLVVVALAVLFFWFALICKRMGLLR
ncbi:hypothetical protein L1F30_16450 [Simiduia sp. 21SJ11W-1]|uniref:hypothetical protein n=1 Tax=Simiduia sp. 21SJ11W-1 TaxID=2909669 RepID=UPI00209DF717|nr:hypothetical protein [Simiduia sp. 21SJ11W-1]UTA47733.1 hypothetical protein L1F30_16450 [Simiduia sp. 21SJ11W-1]